MHNNDALLKATPRLAPSVHLLTRSRDEIQLGLDPKNSVRMPSVFRQILEQCNGSTKIIELLELAIKKDLDAGSTLQILEMLINQNLLVTAIGELRTLTTNQLSHLSDARRSTLQNSNAIVNRTNSHISIIGAGRLGLTLALLLGNSGFANLRIIDYKLTKKSDLIPWGAARVDIGIRRDFVAQTLLERIHQGQLKSMRLKESLAKPDLYIFAPDPIADFPWLRPELADSALRTDTAFLVAASSPNSSLVTSILNPGISGCIRCFHLSQTDRDPAWPQLITQLIGKTIPDPTPVDLVLRTALFAFKIITNWIDHKEYLTNKWWQINEDRVIEFENYPHVNCGCFWQLAQAQVTQ